MWRRDRSGARDAAWRSRAALKGHWVIMRGLSELGLRAVAQLIRGGACRVMHVCSMGCACAVCMSRVELELVDRWEKTAPKIVKISPNATILEKNPPLRGMSASGGLRRRKKSLFQWGKCEIGFTVILYENYAANALFYVMGMQDPMRTSRAHVTVV